MADWCYSECLNGNIGMAGVWNGGFCKHPKRHKKGSGLSRSGDVWDFLEILLGSLMTLIPLSARKPQCDHLGYY